MDVQIASLILYLIQVGNIQTLAIDEINCGIDENPVVHEGLIDDVKTYPWLGVFYFYDVSDDDYRAVTPVVLIQDEFVLANADDIGPIPKKHFRKNSRVLLGEHWIAEGRRVRNYVLHPEYGQTYNTLALIQLKEGINRYRRIIISPICPAPSVLRTPILYVVRMKENYEDLQKEVLQMTHIPARMCRDFYVAANLYVKKMRPPFVICAVALESEKLCVWNSGAALVTRDVWGRWMLLGLGVRGPGCKGPARFLDMHNYYPWIHNSLAMFRRITISKINDQKYVLRSTGFWEPTAGRRTQPTRSTGLTQRFGNCDEEEKTNSLYRDIAVFRTDSTSFTFATYNLTIRANIEVSCMTLEIINGSSVADMSVRHYCTRAPNGGPCYAYKGSLYDVSVLVRFAGFAFLEVNVWGWEKQMKLLDIMEWKWEEGSFYNDFVAQREEYRGFPQMTDFGVEPLDEFMWVPDYDLWTTSTDQSDKETEDLPPLQVLFTTAKYISRTSSRRPTGTKWPLPTPSPPTTPTTTTPTTTTTTTIPTTTTGRRTPPTSIGPRNVAVVVELTTTATRHADFVAKSAAGIAAPAIGGGFAQRQELCTTLTWGKRRRLTKVLSYIRDGWPSTYSRITFPPDQAKVLQKSCRNFRKKYSTYESRLASFAKWPYTEEQKPPIREYADAGLFYTGKKDFVQCMCCGKKFFSDNIVTKVLPWHAYWTWDTCKFLQVMIKERTQHWFNKT